MKYATKRLRYCNLFRCPCVYSNRKKQVGSPAWKLKKRNFLAWRFEYEDPEPISLVLPTRALAGDFYLCAGERCRNHNYGEKGRRSYSATTARLQQPPGVPQRHRRG